MHYNKSILLVNQNRNISKLIELHLKGLGFNIVALYDETLPPFKYKNIFYKLNNVIRRSLFKDYNYINYLKDKHHHDFSIGCLNKIKKTIKDKFDYAIFFRADKCPMEIIDFARNRSNKCLNYQYDGVSVSKKPFDILIKNFDHTFVFDYDDIIKFPQYNFRFLTNFYYKDSYREETNIYDFYYVGVDVDRRRDILSRIYNHFSNKDKEYNFLFILTTNHSQNFAENGINNYKKDKSLDYQKNLKYTRESTVLIDIQQSFHKGLSFRFFEALYYKKKIITNNESVANYDFYNPNNILITDFTDFQKIEKFIELPYIEIDTEIVEKYSFNNWILNLLDLGEYIEISEKTVFKK